MAVHTPIYEYTFQIDSVVAMPFVPFPLIASDLLGLELCFAVQQAREITVRNCTEVR